MGRKMKQISLGKHTNIAETIITGLIETKKEIRKNVFVGVDKRWHRLFDNIRRKGKIITFLSDYEKAKECLD